MDIRTISAEDLRKEVRRILDADLIYNTARVFSQASEVNRRSGNKFYFYIADALNGETDSGSGTVEEYANIVFGSGTISGHIRYSDRAFIYSFLEPVWREIKEGTPKIDESKIYTAQKEILQTAHRFKAKVCNSRDNPIEKVQEPGERGYNNYHIYDLTVHGTSISVNFYENRWGGPTFVINFFGKGSFVSADYRDEVNNISHELCRYWRALNSWNDIERFVEQVTIITEEFQDYVERVKKNFLRDFLRLKLLNSLLKSLVGSQATKTGLTPHISSGFSFDNGDHDVYKLSICIKDSNNNIEYTKGFPKGKWDVSDNDIRNVVEHYKAIHSVAVGEGVTLEIGQ